MPSPSRSTETAPLVPVKLDVNGVFDHIVGERGLGRDALVPTLERASVVLEEIARSRAVGDLPFFDLAYDETTVAALIEAAAEVQARFSKLVVLGIGGSALGTKAVLDGVPVSARSGDVEVVVLDNLDPHSFSSCLEQCDLSETLFNVISKSGETAETMAQFLIVRDRLERELGTDSVAEHIVCTTDPDGGVLRSIAEEEGFRTFPVPPGVGGRFSVMSAVGLLPLAVAGVDIEAMASGARAMDRRTSEPNPIENPAALHAAVLYEAARERGLGMHVLMPYADGLLRLAEWYGQLWAESLGKRVDREGNEVFAGHTPVRALGATDQHSQVQLYIEGPHDKVVTFMRVTEWADDVCIPSRYERFDGLGCLADHGLGQLLNMEQRATELALAEAGRLSSVIEVGHLSPATFGQLFHLFSVQTLVMGGLLNVDPLNQPGVEAGKKKTYAMAGRSGYDEFMDEVRERLRAKRADLVLD